MVSLVVYFVIELKQELYLCTSIYMMAAPTECVCINIFKQHKRERYSYRPGLDLC